MKKSAGLRLSALIVLVLFATLISSSVFATSHQLKRRVAPKQFYQELPAYSDCDVIVLKLREGTKRPAHNERRFLTSGREWEALNGVLSLPDGSIRLRPMLSLAPSKLDEMRAEGSRRIGWQLPDLTLYFEIRLEDISDQQRVDLINQINSLNLVEIAYFAPKIEVPAGPPEGKGPPSSDPEDTPSFEFGQYYLHPAPVGFDAYYAWSFPGGHGENVKVIDIEYSWNPTHEDLHGGTDDFHIAGEIYDGEDGQHGTAVLGCIAADSNDFGMTGIAYAADIGTIAIGYMNIPDAIATASANSEPGDIILLECQGPGPTGAWVCVEYWQDTFDAILTASALGRIVVEAAANGNQDYDDTALFDSLFYPEYRFSGAILTAMSNAFHVPDTRTCYGQRLDVHGFGGHDVYTLGYGHLWGTDENTFYTQGFSGTSSASAEMAGVCAVAQSVYEQHTSSTLDHAGLRSLLTTYSVPQADHYKNIGPLPDLAGICDAVTGFTRPTSPTLVSPDDGAYFDSPAQPTLDWDDVTGALSYEIQVDNDFRFPSPDAYADGLTASEWTSSMLQQGKYFWRVRAVNADGFGAWSDVRTVLVDVQIQAPTLLSPEDEGATTTCFNVPLEWYAVAGVNDYIVQVDTLADFNTPHISTYSLSCEDGTCFYGVHLLVLDNYFWRVRALADNSPWSEIWSFEPRGPWAPRIAVPGETTDEPVAVSLGANYPNPFNPITQITFSLPSATHARLEVFNILGQKVTTLVDRHLSAGQHSVTWDASENPSGVYLYRLTTGETVMNRKMLLLK